MKTRYLLLALLIAAGGCKKQAIADGCASRADRAASTVGETRVPMAAVTKGLVLRCPTAA
jgi:hypothetical protein